MSLPTQTEMFAAALWAIDDARNELSRARDWLNSDWAPLGSSLPNAAGKSRMEVRRQITDAKIAMDDMKRQLSAAIASIERETENRK